jgi:GMP synthase (glutamine-hydrolysing)
MSNSDKHVQAEIAVIDFGSQYTQLIARRLRDIGAFSQIYTCYNYQEVLNRPEIRGVILSGGPSSVNDENAPDIGAEIFDMDVPVLGVCYGMQLMCQKLGGSLESSDKREYGPAAMELTAESDFYRDVPTSSGVWMSHGDRVGALPDGFTALAKSDSIPFAAAGDADRGLYCVQYHPEVVHTEFGMKMLENFTRLICGLTETWSASTFVDDAIAEIREKVGKGRVLCGVSGGVDSTVVATLIDKAVGDQLHCVFVDNGLLRLGEAGNVERDLNAFLHRPIVRIDARNKFITNLASVSEPEQKRKIIGRTFIEVFQNAVRDQGDFDFLAQGTLYPDRIESLSINGPSHVIKSHHNVGGLPEVLGFSLIEPLRDLFKDEVRRVGRSLGIPDSLLQRHPFPGPGLAVRILGDITLEKIRLLQAADHIFIQELLSSGEYSRIWQAGAILLPVSTVGVMGDQRTYERVIALRAVTSQDGMTADWSRIPPEVLARVSNRIINEVKGINRVVYDVSSKPPSTIEWE